MLIFQFSSTLTDMKNRPVFTLNPQEEQAGFSAFTPWGRGKKAEKPGWILICQSRISLQSIRALIIQTIVINIFCYVVIRKSVFILFW
jgi:hypothetical protein